MFHGGLCFIFAAIDKKDMDSLRGFWFVLEFYGPVNNEVMSSRSVYVGKKESKNKKEML